MASKPFYKKKIVFRVLKGNGNKWTVKLHPRKIERITLSRWFVGMLTARSLCTLILDVLFTIQMIQLWKMIIHYITKLLFDSLDLRITLELLFDLLDFMHFFIIHIFRISYTIVDIIYRSIPTSNFYLSFIYVCIKCLRSTLIV